MKFGNTFLLYLIPLWVGFVGIIILWGQRRKSKRLNAIIAHRLAPLLLSNYHKGRESLKHILLLCIIALIGFALAAPKWGYKEEERHVKGVDLLIAVDVSKSMLAEDIRPNRLERTKLAILDLIKTFDGHRIGLIAFSGTSFLQCPLTLDHNAFIQSLNAMDTDTIPIPGTAINAAIELAENIYGQTQNQKLLFLFSDGEELADSATKGAQHAKEQDIHIFTIGIGSIEGSIIPIMDRKTQKVKPLCDRNGQVIKTVLDEKTLQEIAHITDGNYYHLSPVALSKLQKDILTRFPLLKESIKENKYIERVYQERYQLFLCLAFLLLLIEILIPTYKKPEQYSISIYHKLSLWALVFLLLAPQLPARESDGEIAYKAGKFKEALEFYEQQLKKTSHDPTLLFNKGTTHLALGQFEEAIECLKKSIPNAPVELQKKEFYNLGNAHFEQGKQLQDPQKTLEKWKESSHHFQSAVDLDGTFEDAKKNARYVNEQIKKLEEQLKQQQQQNRSDDSSQSDDQQQHDPKSDDQKKQDQQQNQNSENPESSNQQKKDDQESNDQQKKDQQQDTDDPKQDDRSEKDDQDSKQQEQSDQQKQANDQQKKDDQDSSDQQKNQQDSPDLKKARHEDISNQDEQRDQKMTKADALRFLDALENDEKKLPLQPINASINNRDPDKFW